MQTVNNKQNFELVRTINILRQSFSPLNPRSSSIINYVQHKMTKISLKIVLVNVYTILVKVPQECLQQNEKIFSLLNTSLWLHKFNWSNGCLETFKFVTKHHKGLWMFGFLLYNALIFLKNMFCIFVCKYKMNNCLH